AYAPGHRVDIWADMITLTEISALAGAVVNLTTVFKQRAPGMSLNRIPLFVWAQVVTSFMILFAMPAVMLVSGYLAMDRLANVNTHFFNPAEGGDALLYQHLFWFFGHPEVYIIFIPATGMGSSIVETFSGRRIFAYPVMVLSLIATGFIGFGPWVHHMFATPIPLLGRTVLLVPEMDRANAERIVRQMEFLDAVHRVQPHIVSNAHPRSARDDAPHLHLRGRDGVGKFESARHSWGRHHRAQRSSFCCECTHRASTGRSCRCHPMACTDIGMGNGVPTAGIQFLP